MYPYESKFPNPYTSKPTGKLLVIERTPVAKTNTKSSAELVVYGINKGFI